MYYSNIGNEFEKIEAVAPKKGTLIVIHGWGVRGRFMMVLAKFFAKQGYEVYNFDYPTSKYGIEEHGENFLKEYRKLISNLPKNEKINFIVHSMGGLLTRVALSKMNLAELEQINNIVMLGTPNQGSYLAEIARILKLGCVNQSLVDMGTASKAFVNNINKPLKVPNIGVIQGRFDTKVRGKATHLIDMPYHHVIMNTTHNGLVFSKKVFRKALHFIENGVF